MCDIFIYVQYIILCVIYCTSAVLYIVLRVCVMNEMHMRFDETLKKQYNNKCKYVYTIKKQIISKVQKDIIYIILFSFVL